MHCWSIAMDLVCGWLILCSRVYEHLATRERYSIIAESVVYIYIFLSTLVFRCDFMQISWFKQGNPSDYRISSWLTLVIWLLFIGRLTLSIKATAEAATLAATVAHLIRFCLFAGSSLPFPRFSHKHTHTHTILAYTFFATNWGAVKIYHKADKLTCTYYTAI